MQIKILGVSVLTSLNPMQQEAVLTEGHTLVLAGAGSGKTRVLIHRITHLINQGVSPHLILAVTFTNKASGEMQQRLDSVLTNPWRGMWVGTFHSLAHRFLRLHWQEAGLPQHFNILDSDDQLRIVKKTLKELNLADSKWQPREVQWFISGQKDAGIRADAMIVNGDFYLKTMQKIYAAYERTCEQSGLVDFAELLLRTFELLNKQPALLEHYQQRFRYILVDEFQDTNSTQYAWLKLLAGPTTQIMIVGDDDQSIYGWRGAKVENINRFCHDFPTTHIVRLEQNYRSTTTILEAANALINNNTNRMGKKLWTEGQEGSPIVLYPAFNEMDEARFVVEYLRDWVQQEGRNYNEVALLYRSNAQSRVLEDALLHRGIPYRIYGGLRFFERAEIKDVLAYLRLMAHQDDDSSFERVVNTPTRGIGEKTIMDLRMLSQQNGISLWRAAAILLEQSSLSSRAHNALKGFIDLIESLAAETASFTLDKQVDHVIQHSGLWAAIKMSKNERAESRLENLQELVNAAKEFMHTTEEQDMTILEAFLSHAALEAGDHQAAPQQDCVQLMTLHSAKGLEFPLVFITGLEEGLFPHAGSRDEADELEEERRLCYVGITRAMEKLVLSYAEVRRQYGREEYHMPSRFIRELPAELIQAIRTTTVTKPSSMKQSASISYAEVEDTGLRIGQVVSHKTFGEGVITNYEGSGASARVQVKFKQQGMKWLVLAYANLEPVTTDDVFF